MLEASVQEGLEDDIVHFYLEANRKYLFVAYKAGRINVFEINGLMHYARDFKLVTSYEIKNQATTMQLHSRQRVLFVGDNLGLVNLIDTKTSDTFSSPNSPVVLEVFDQPIAKILFFAEDNCVLISSHSRACHVPLADADLLAAFELRLQRAAVAPHALLADQQEAVRHRPVCAGPVPRLGRRARAEASGKQECGRRRRP